MDRFKSKFCLEILLKFGVFSNFDLTKIHITIEFSYGSKTIHYKNLKNTNGFIWKMKVDDSIKIKGKMKFKVDDVSFKL